MPTLVDGVARLCVMNLVLHGIGGEDSPIAVKDALAAHPGTNYDMVLTNPPFGRKSSVTIVNEVGEQQKDGFPPTTAGMTGDGQSLLLESPHGRNCSF